LPNISLWEKKIGKFPDLNERVILKTLVENRIIYRVTKKPGVGVDEIPEKQT